MGAFGPLTRAYHIFEPLSGNFARLKQRLESGSVPRHEKVHAYNCCVGPVDGEVIIKTHDDVSTTASVLVDNIMVGGKSIRNSLQRACPQVALDTFIQEQNLASVDTIKIDVEGYEWDVLQGARNSLSNGTIRSVYFEFGQHQNEVGQSFRQFWDFLRGNGFHIYRTAHSRNFFGLQHIEEYHASLENFSSIWMVLASRDRHSEKLNRPKVIGRYDPVNI
jgi:FkbM family methyltransferase